MLLSINQGTFHPSSSSNIGSINQSHPSSNEIPKTPSEVYATDVDTQRVEVHSKIPGTYGPNQAVYISQKLANIIKKLDAIAWKVKNKIESDNQLVDLFATNGRSIARVKKAKEKQTDGKIDIHTSTELGIQAGGGNCELMSGFVATLILDDKTLCENIETIQICAMEHHQWTTVDLKIEGKAHSIVVDPWPVFPPFVYPVTLGKFEKTEVIKTIPPIHYPIEQFIKNFDKLNRLSDQEIDKYIINEYKMPPGEEFIKFIISKNAPNEENQTPPNQLSWTPFNQLFSIKNPDIEFYITDGEQFKLNIVKREYWQKVSQALDKIDALKDKDPQLINKLRYNRHGSDIWDFEKLA